MGAVGRARHERALAFGPDLPLVYDVGHRVLAHALALSVQRPAHARAAVHAAVLLVHALDLHRQRLASPGPRAGRSPEPGVVTRAAHRQYLAGNVNRKLADQMRFDEGKLHGCCSLAKNCAAFFKISRSISSRAFSLRSRRSSLAITPSPLGARP